MYKNILSNWLLIFSLALLVSGCTSGTSHNLNNSFAHKNFTFKINNDLTQNITIEDKREFSSAFIRDFIKKSDFASISSVGYPLPIIQFYDTKNNSICSYSYVISNDLTINKRIEGCKKISNIIKLNELIAYSEIVDKHIIDNLNEELEKYSQSNFDDIYNSLYKEYLEIANNFKPIISDRNKLIENSIQKKIQDKIQIKNTVSSNKYNKYDIYFKYKDNLDTNSIKNEFTYNISLEKYNNIFNSYKIYFDKYEFKNIYFKDLRNNIFNISEVYFNFIPISFISENGDIKVNIRTLDNGYKPYSLIFLNKVKQNIEIKKITIHFDGNIIDDITTNIIVPPKTATKMNLEQNKRKSDNGFRLLNTKQDSYKYGISIFYTVGNNNKTLYDIKDYKIDDFDTITIMTGI